MNQFPKAHLWMILPFFVAITGFYFSYWSVWSTIPFHLHLHGLTATAWYILLIAQPWLIKKNNVNLHRKMGFIGLFLAGGVIFSALQIVPNNLTNENLQAVLRYGLTWIDFVVIIGFSFSVIMAMMNSRQVSIHARYMISSAFWALLPALARLVFFPMVISTGFPPPISFIQVIYICALLIIIVLGVMMFYDYRKEKIFYGAYIFVGLGTLFFGLTFVYIGEAQWWIDFCHNSLLK